MPNSNYYPEYYREPDRLDPCWNDDWERDLLRDGYKTISGWNSLGRVVRKGERGIYLSCARHTVFSIDETDENQELAKIFIKKRLKNIKPPEKKYKPLKKNDFFIFLIKNKFEYIYTASNIWKDAFKLSINDNSLFILFRKNGVDVKFFDGSLGEFFLKSDKYGFKSGYKLSFNYEEHQQSIFYSITQIILAFKSGGNVKFLMDGELKKMEPVGGGYPFGNP